MRSKAALLSTILLTSCVATPTIPKVEYQQVNESLAYKKIIESLSKDQDVFTEIDLSGLEKSEFETGDQHTQRIKKELSKFENKTLYMDIPYKLESYNAESSEAVLEQLVTSKRTYSLYNGEFQSVGDSKRNPLPDSENNKKYPGRPVNKEMMLYHGMRLTLNHNIEVTNYEAQNAFGSVTVVEKRRGSANVAIIDNPWMKGSYRDPVEAWNGSNFFLADSNTAKLLEFERTLVKLSAPDAKAIKEDSKPIFMRLGLQFCTTGPECYAKGNITVRPNRKNPVDVDIEMHKLGGTLISMALFYKTSKKPIATFVNVKYLTPISQN